jgi:hypothetical protein
MFAVTGFNCSCGGTRNRMHALTTSGRLPPTGGGQRGIPFPTRACCYNSADGLAKIRREERAG